MLCDMLNHVELCWMIEEYWIYILNDWRTHDRLNHVESSRTSDMLNHVESWWKNMWYVDHDERTCDMLNHVVHFELC